MLVLFDADFGDLAIDDFHSHFRQGFSLLASIVEIIEAWSMR